MKRTILIPTDFSIESLNLFKAAVQTGASAPVHIVFVHGAYSSVSVMDLMFSSPRKIHESLITANFRNACTIIRNKFASSISSDRIEFFSGITQSAFQNFLEGNNIDEIFIPKNYTFTKASDRSFDILPFIRNSRLQTHEVFWQRTDSIREKNMLAELFSDSPVVSIP
jgi:hypothetical protein